VAEEAAGGAAPKRKFGGPPEGAKNPYWILPWKGPYDVKIGRALITMVEPHVGHEASYNRWYEDDHFYAGAMAFPWMMAGRRWVATRRLQELRYPRTGSPIADPITAGPYITVYWIVDGQFDGMFKWSVSVNQRLADDDRIHNERTHLYTSFQSHQFAAYRDGDVGPRDFHALDHPYAGLVTEVIDAPDADGRPALLEWLRDEYVPGLLADTSVAMCVAFNPEPMPGGPDSHVQNTPGIENRVTLLHFCQVDPSEIWADVFAGNGAKVAASGFGQVVFSSPWIPTIPGTDTYVDELR